MVSLKQVVYYLGESKVHLTSREIALKINRDLEHSKTLLNKERRRVQQLIYEYKQFFMSKPVSDNPSDGKRYILSKNGIRFFERIEHTYDPVTNTQIIPQDINIKVI